MDGSSSTAKNPQISTSIILRQVYTGTNQRKHRGSGRILMEVMASKHPKQSTHMERWNDRTRGDEMGLSMNRRAAEAEELMQTGN